jgi:hypothetical protein
MSKTNYRFADCCFNCQYYDRCKEISNGGVCDSFRMMAMQQQINGVVDVLGVLHGTHRFPNKEEKS